MTRRGLVLGAGGVLGAAWTIGALAAVQDECGWDPREAEVLVGTSAGSVLAASLGCGIGVDDLLAHQRGARRCPGIDYDHDGDAGGALPPLPRPGHRLAARASCAAPCTRCRTTPMMALSTVLPQGRGVARAGRPARRRGRARRAAGRRTRATWVVAMDYDSGRRVVVRPRRARRRARLRDAVMASCSIPGWYAPVRIGGRRYVDGGACSPTSLDLVAAARAWTRWSCCRR